jgi:hypothetical protein
MRYTEIRFEDGGIREDGIPTLLVIATPEPSAGQPPQRLNMPFPKGTNLRPYFGRVFTKDHIDRYIDDRQYFDLSWFVVHHIVVGNIAPPRLRKP